jgi:hypothetical protein
VLTDRTVEHIYNIENGLIQRMDIRETEGRETEAAQRAGQS